MIFGFIGDLSWWDAELQILVGFAVFEWLCVLNSCWTVERFFNMMPCKLSQGATPVDQGTLPQDAEQIFAMSQNISDAQKEDLAWATYILLRNTNTIAVVCYSNWIDSWELLFTSLILFVSFKRKWWIYVLKLSTYVYCFNFSVDINSRWIMCSWILEDSR